MVRALDQLEDIRDAVEAHAGAACAQIARDDAEGLAAAPRGLTREPAAQGLVDHGLEGAARAARLGSELRGYVLVEGNRRAHILMLATTHHGVKMSLLRGATIHPPVTHPVFGYRVGYRRVLEIQTRLLARLVAGNFRGTQASRRGEVCERRGGAR